VFERLLADGFVSTENDQMLDRTAVLNSVVAGSDVVAARNDSMVLWPRRIMSPPHARPV